jgi:transcriptional regulator with XRE-family HTH domain
VTPPWRLADQRLDTDRSPHVLEIPVQRAVRKLGQDIGDARKRRRIPMAILAERAGISRTTLTKIEKGDAGVIMANYAAVLFALGLIDRLSEVADVRHDKVGLELAEEALPQRVRNPRRKSPTESR